MDTLKQILAFPLLLTTVFLLSTFSPDYRIAALTMLIGVWFACWWIGQVPAWAEIGKKAGTWVGAVSVAVLFGWASFQWLGPIEKRIAWQPYTEARLQQLTSEGKTVMIDFTADWCNNCHFNLATAIETEKVAKLIRENRVVPLIADWSNPSEEIEAKLQELNSNGIPVLAIYPAEKPSEPIVFRAILTESTVLKALEEAGPSQATRTVGTQNSSQTFTSTQRAQ